MFFCQMFVVKEKFMTRLVLTKKTHSINQSMKAKSMVKKSKRLLKRI
jgi:hypothetical protein